MLAPIVKRWNGEDNMDDNPGRGYKSAAMDIVAALGILSLYAISGFGCKQYE